MHQARHILSLRLLDELDGGWKVHAQVLRPMIGYRYLKVLNLSSVLELIRQCGHVQDVANVVLLDLVDVLAVRGIAQEQSWKNLNRFAAVRLQRVVGSTFAIGRLR